MLTVNKISKNISFIALAEPQSVSNWISVPHGEVSQSVLDFWYYSLITFKQTLI